MKGGKISGATDRTSRDLAKGFSEWKRSTDDTLTRLIQVVDRDPRPIRRAATDTSSICTCLREQAVRSPW